MDSDAIADLKQFIEATVSQQLSLQTKDLADDIESRINKRIDTLDTKIDRVEEKIDNISAAVGEAIETSNEETDKQLKNHEHCITKLENQTA